MDLYITYHITVSIRKNFTQLVIILHLKCTGYELSKKNQDHTVPIDVKYPIPCIIPTEAYTKRDVKSFYPFNLPTFPTIVLLCHDLKTKLHINKTDRKQLKYYFFL